MVVSIKNAEHYCWGEVCDGWPLLKHADLSVIQERVPAGAGEVRHIHEIARQLFYVLEGEATLIFDDREFTLQKGDALEVPPHTAHLIQNRSQADVHFLVISHPTTRGDRIDL